MDNERYGWIKFYSAFADKLLEFQSDRKTLLNKLEEIHRSLGLKVQRLERDGSLVDIDPFTVFGMFNKGITNANRFAILKAIAKSFNITTAQVPSEFDGIPVLNNLSAAFFDWDRNKLDIDNLWSLFKVALSYADSEDKTQYYKEFVEIYNRVIKQPRIKWNITMGLFWIRPNFFLNLDSRSRWFIETCCQELVERKIKEKMTLPKAETYISLCQLMTVNLSASNYQYKTLAELSYVAYVESERVNQEIKDSKAEQLADSNKTNTIRYWLYAPGQGAEKWDEFYNKGIMAIRWGKLGNLLHFEDRNKLANAIQTTYQQSGSCKNDALALWQFAREIKAGDVIFVKKGTRQIIGCGIVESDYIYDETQPDYFYNVHKVKWTHRGVWDHPDGQAVLKTLTDITKYENYVHDLFALFKTPKEETVEKISGDNAKYGMENFLKEVFMTPDEYSRIARLIKYKKNIILQGAPGVGKTFLARRLAYSIIGEINPDRVEMVQFHQNYGYEDFIMGYKPTENHFELTMGIFYQFCKKAAENKGDYFFIIDEINRGNLSKIFGELLMLIEHDKRGESYKVKLAYKNEYFYVPENVYIIGMMNTADRSLAMMDYALRRRFTFVDILPAFDRPQFAEYLRVLNISSGMIKKIIGYLTNLNNIIADENTSGLGGGYCIGHSYFCTPPTIGQSENEWYEDIVDFEIAPLLHEYWWDDKPRADECISELKKQ